MYGAPRRILLRREPSRCDGVPGRGRLPLRHSELPRLRAPSRGQRTTSPAPLPVLSLRAIGHTHSAFVVETLIEELAMRARLDPIAYRLKLVDPDAVKSRAALSLLQEKSAAWRGNLPGGHALGTALSEYRRSACACIVDVSIEGGRPRIHRVMVAVHCGPCRQPTHGRESVRKEASSSACRS